jgi:hypothetical protein
VAISAVRAVPPRLSCSSLVSLLFLYCTKELTGSAASAAITLPSADSDVLMLFASDRRAPLLEVRATLSEPARSTISSLLRSVRVYWAPFLLPLLAVAVEARPGRLAWLELRLLTPLPPDCCCCCWVCTSVASLCSMLMVSTVWLRLLVAFIRVGAMARFSSPRLINASASWYSVTTNSCRPST